MTLSTANIEAVCSLEGERLEDRIAMIRRDLLPKVRKTRCLANGVIYEFDASPRMRAQLDAFVSFERTCCSNLGWNVREEGSTLELHVDGVNPRAFRSQIKGVGERRLRGAPIAHFAKAAGLGLGASILICCVLPLGLALVFGAAVATPFMFLDDPLWIGVGSLTLAVPVWIYLGRKPSKKAKTDLGCGC